MGHRQTIVSDDGEFKAELHAWKDYWFFYASIGSECTVYHREETKDTWGNTKTDWVKTSATIQITNRYSGKLDVPPGTGPLPTTPAGGAGVDTIIKTALFQGDHGEIREWAAGFFNVNINLDAGTERTLPAGASLRIDRVDAEITVGVGRHQLRGSVSASTFVKEQSPW